MTKSLKKPLSVEKEIEYLRFAMREPCGCKVCEDERANIGENCVIRQALTEAHQAGIDEAVDRIFGEIDEFKAEVISMDYCDDFKDGIYATIEHILSMPVFESVLVPPELRQDNK